MLGQTCINIFVSKIDTKQQKYTVLLHSLCVTCDVYFGSYFQMNSSYPSSSVSSLCIGTGSSGRCLLSWAGARPSSGGGQGRSPVCFCRWTLKVRAAVNLRPQMAQPYWGCAERQEVGEPLASHLPHTSHSSTGLIPGFCPTWTHVWFWSTLAWPQRLPHVSQTNGRSPV